MKKLPKSDNSLLLRVDFSNDVAWNALQQFQIQNFDKIGGEGRE
jgi:hypothetical protein